MPSLTKTPLPIAAVSLFVVAEQVVQVVNVDNVAVAFADGFAAANFQDAIVQAAGFADFVVGILEFFGLFHFGRQLVIFRPAFVAFCGMAFGGMPDLAFRYDFADV